MVFACKSLWWWRCGGLRDDLRLVVLAVLVLLHQNGILWLIPRDSMHVACLPCTEEEIGALRLLAPAWPWLSGLTSAKPHEVHLAWNSLPLRSQPEEADPLGGLGVVRLARLGPSRGS